MKTRRMHRRLKQWRRHRMLRRAMVERLRLENLAIDEATRRMNEEDELPF